jgi:hypothetical protein
MHQTRRGFAQYIPGGDDANSWKGLTLPWLKVLDGFNVFDEAIPQSVSGGVTTSLILPGSADAIGELLVKVLNRSDQCNYRWTGVCGQVTTDNRRIAYVTSPGASVCSQWHRSNRAATLETHETRHWRESFSRLRRLGLYRFLHPTADRFSLQAPAWTLCGPSVKPTTRLAKSRKLRMTIAHEPLRGCGLAWGTLYPKI